MNLGNYADVLRQLTDAGLLVDELIIGRRVRCRVEGDRERRGWYHLHELMTDSGGSLIVGSFGIWRGTDNGAQKVAIERGKAQLNAEQRAALRARIEADRRAADAERKAQAARAADRASRMWARLTEDGESDYLRLKCVANHGGRYGPGGALVIPLLDAHGRIHGLQAIYPAGHRRRKQLGRDKDFWPSGLAKQGHFFLLGTPAAGGICLLAEGYATAASVFEATGLPTAVAFDAGNLVHVANALRVRWPRVRLLVCADDDYLGKCPKCQAFVRVAEPGCPACGAEHGRGNAGITGASTAALAVNGAWMVPLFLRAERPTDKKGPTDFNDLHVLEGLHVVRSQIEARLTELKWRSPSAAAVAADPNGGGVGGGELRSITSLDELHERFSLVYEAADTVFDHQEHKLVPLASMRNLCSSRQLHRWWMESSDKRVVRLEEVGFDPTERDETIKCNLWAGWPTWPKSGRCEKLLELGTYLCSEDARGAELWLWLLKWLAYPLQHQGAKMKTAIIMHGPQGTGKNLFFEAVLRMYGNYGQVVDQDAVEDKHNDYLSRKLMLVADEVVARMEMFQAKNKLKTLVTSDWITINPKFVTRYRERNHVNLVFLSNEIVPMALERDDRRYAVIWTPPKLDSAFYNAVLAEIEAGGVEALHHHLLHLDLGDFGPATLPPMTAAKVDLIELGMDSTERFYGEWIKGWLPVPAVTCRSEDLYEAYRHWCLGEGVLKPAQKATFIGNTAKRPGVRKGREWHYLVQGSGAQGQGRLKRVAAELVDGEAPDLNAEKAVQSMLIAPPGAEIKATRQVHADSIAAFAHALTEWKRPHRAGKDEGDDKPF